MQNKLEETYKTQKTNKSNKSIYSNNEIQVENNFRCLLNNSNHNISRIISNKKKEEYNNQTQNNLSAINQNKLNISYINNISDFNGISNIFESSILSDKTYQISNINISFNLNHEDEYFKEILKKLKQKYYQIKKDKEILSIASVNISKNRELLRQKELSIQNEREILEKELQEKDKYLKIIQDEKNTININTSKNIKDEILFLLENKLYLYENNLKRKIEINILQNTINNNNLNNFDVIYCSLEKNDKNKSIGNKNGSFIEKKEFNQVKLKNFINKKINKSEIQSNSNSSIDSVEKKNDNNIIAINRDLKEKKEINYEKRNKLTQKIIKKEKILINPSLESEMKRKINIKNKIPINNNSKLKQQIGSPKNILIEQLIGVNKISNSLSKNNKIKCENFGIKFVSQKNSIEKDNRSLTNNKINISIHKK